MNRPVSDSTPEDMFSVHPKAPRGVPIDAINAACLRAEGVLSLLVHSFNTVGGSMAGVVYLNAAWGLQSPLDAVRALADWGYKTSTPRPDVRCTAGAFDPSVYSDTPEGMLTVSSPAPPGMPIDAITACCCRGDAVIGLLMDLFESPSSEWPDDAAICNALQSLAGVFREIRTLADWGNRTTTPAAADRRGRPASSSTGGPL